MMFSSDKNIENLQQLYQEVKQYVNLQRDYVKIELVEKLTILGTSLLLVLVLIILGFIALFYLSFTLAYLLEPLVGSLKGSFAIITGHHTHSHHRHDEEKAHRETFGKLFSKTVTERGGRRR